MPKKAYRSNFGEWENEPRIQDKVIAYMDSIGAPMLLREVYRPLGLHRTIVNRVLGRLHAKGVLTRYKVPIETHVYDNRARKLLSGAATRQCYLYCFAEAPGL